MPASAVLEARVISKAQLSGIGPCYRVLGDSELVKDSSFDGSSCQAFRILMGNLFRVYKAVGSRSLGLVIEDGSGCVGISWQNIEWAKTVVLKRGICQGLDRSRGKGKALRRATTPVSVQQ